MVEQVSVHQLVVTTREAGRPTPPVSVAWQRDCCREHCVHQATAFGRPPRPSTTTGAKQSVLTGPDSMDRRHVTVAIFNTSPDTVDLLRVVLEQAGFVVVSAFTYELRDGKVDVESFVRQHRPKVIVYDVAPPYEANWHLFQALSTMPSLRSCHFVVTTTNVARLREVAGSSQDLHEIVGKPLDLHEVVQAVVEAAHQRLAR